MGLSGLEQSGRCPLRSFGDSSPLCAQHDLAPLHQRDDARPPTVEQLARATLAEFRAANARYPGDTWFEQLIEDLKQISPEFCCWWLHHDVRGTLDGYKAMAHPVLGQLEFEHINLQMLGDPDVRIMIYSPRAETRAKLEHFLAMEPASHL